jgi:uncharacterized protein YjlB
VFIEEAKRIVERMTGFGRPRKAALPDLIRKRKPLMRHFLDDGETPNNPVLPLVLFRNAVVLNGEYDPAAVIEEIFAANGWGDSWRDGVYEFRHFHTMTHEVLGIARGEVKVEFGGAKGKAITLKAGDVAILPAGTSHRRLSASRDLLVVGAYPKHGKYDEPRPGEIDHDKAREAIAKVKRPATDPLYGRNGPLTSLWKS